MAKLNTTNINGTLTINNIPILDIFYPIGSVYISVNSTNPGTIMGGTWVSWGSGRVPVGVNTSDTNFSTVEKTGGASSVSHTHTTAGHTLTVNEIPSHSHSSTFGFYGQAGSGGYAYCFDLFANTNRAEKTLYTSSVGGGSSHNHGNTGSKTVSVLQPYITCYMWKRTA